MSRLIPIVIAVIAIAALTLVEGRISERWGDNRLCDYCVTLLTDVPKQIGSWVGEDGEVDDMTQEVAGARGYVSRTYRNEQTGQAVGVWLIVGHARDTARHTPNVCYGGNGFRNDGIDKHRLLLDDGREVTFRTALFYRDADLGRVQERVFWTWFKPVSQSGEPVVWNAPDNVRYEIGAAPALYKLYFTARGQSADQEPDESVCMEFAREFLSTVDPMLTPANGEIPADFDPAAVPEMGLQKATASGDSPEGADQE